MQEYKKFICVICGFIYDEAEGWPEDGIAPGTCWEDVPENWFCPDCGACKEDFEMIEVDQRSVGIWGNESKIKIIQRKLAWVLAVTPDVKRPQV